MVRLALIPFQRLHPCLHHSWAPEPSDSHKPVGLVDFGRHLLPVARILCPATFANAFLFDTLPRVCLGLGTCRHLFSVSNGVWPCLPLLRVCLGIGTCRHLFSVRNGVWPCSPLLRVCLGLGTCRHLFSVCNGVWPCSHLPRVCFGLGTCRHLFSVRNGIWPCSPLLRVCFGLGTCRHLFLVRNGVWPCSPPTPPPWLWGHGVLQDLPSHLPSSPTASAGSSLVSIAARSLFFPLSSAAAVSVWRDVALCGSHAAAAVSAVLSVRHL